MKTSITITLAMMIGILSFMIGYSYAPIAVKEVRLGIISSVKASSGYDADSAAGYGGPATGGYGDQAPTSGGYGAPASGGYGDPAPAAGGYGAPAVPGYGQ